MKINTEPKYHTAGLNALSVAANIVLAAVVFGSISPWWLLLSIPLLLAGLGVELIEKKTTNFNL